MKEPQHPVHVAGIFKGEELALRSKEAGRKEGRGKYRSARDATSIDPSHREPIDPAMPHLPPA